MSKHDVERARARKAQAVGAKRSQRIASMKRNMTIGVKTAATTAAIAGGVYAVNRCMQRRNVTLNGKSVNFSSQKVGQVVESAKKIKDLFGYVY